MGRVVLERNERAEPISRSHVVKLKVCDPTISEAGRPTAGRPLMCLGEGDGRRAPWQACAPAHWCYRRLLSVEREATHVPILQKKSSHTKWKCRELPRRFSTLPAAGAAGRGPAPLPPALLGGLPVGPGEKSERKPFPGSEALQAPQGPPHCAAWRPQAVEHTGLGTPCHARASLPPRANAHTRMPSPSWSIKEWSVLELSHQALCTLCKSKPNAATEDIGRNLGQSAVTQQKSPRPLWWVTWSPCPSLPVMWSFICFLFPVLLTFFLPGSVSARSRRPVIIYYSSGTHLAARRALLEW